MMGRRLMQEMLGHDPFDDPFFRDPFGMDPFAGFGAPMGGQLGMIENGRRGGGGGNGMSLISFPGMGGMGGMQMMSNMGGGSGSMMVMQSSSFSSDGRTVHSSTTSARMGPGGVAEIQRQEKDGRTGKEQILLERRIGDRARRVEKSRDLHTGDEETVDNTFGIEDGNEEHFDQEFETVASNTFGRQRGYAHARPMIQMQQQQHSPPPPRLIQQGQQHQYQAQPQYQQRQYQQQYQGQAYQQPQQEQYSRQSARVSQQRR